MLKEFPPNHCHEYYMHWEKANQLNICQWTLNIHINDPSDWRDWLCIAFMRFWWSYTPCTPLHHVIPWVLAASYSWSWCWIVYSNYAWCDWAAPPACLCIGDNVSKCCPPSRTQATFRITNLHCWELRKWKTCSTSTHSISTWHFLDWQSIWDECGLIRMRTLWSLSVWCRTVIFHQVWYL